jgi:hypothetical protein
MTEPQNNDHHLLEFRSHLDGTWKIMNKAVHIYLQAHVLVSSSNVITS